MLAVCPPPPPTFWAALTMRVPPLPPSPLSPLLSALKVLPDEQLLAVLAALPADLLGRLAPTSRAMYAFAMEPSLWKVGVGRWAGGREGGGLHSDVVNFGGPFRGAMEPSLSGRRAGEGGGGP